MNFEKYIQDILEPSYYDTRYQDIIKLSSTDNDSVKYANFPMICDDITIKALNVLRFIPSDWQVFPTSKGGIGFQSPSTRFPFALIKIEPDNLLYEYIEPKNDKQMLYFDLTTDFACDRILNFLEYVEVLGCCNDNDNEFDCQLSSNMIELSWKTVTSEILAYDFMIFPSAKGGIAFESNNMESPFMRIELMQNGSVKTLIEYPKYQFNNEVFVFDLAMIKERKAQFDDIVLNAGH